MDRIFFDTNAIKNDRLGHFFGNLKELNKISASCRILLPRIVYDEIVIQKQRYAQKQFDAFIKNDIKKIISLPGDDAIKKVADEKIKKVAEKCRIRSDL